MISKPKEKYSGPLYGASAAMCLLNIAVCTEYGKTRAFDMRALTIICGCIRGKSMSARCSNAWIAKSLNVQRQQVSAAVKRLVLNGFISVEAGYNTRHGGRRENTYTINSTLIEAFKHDCAGYARTLRSEIVDETDDNLVDEIEP